MQSINKKSVPVLPKTNLNKTKTKCCKRVKASYIDYNSKLIIVGRGAPDTPPIKTDVKSDLRRAGGVAPYNYFVYLPLQSI